MERTGNIYSPNRFKELAVRLVTEGWFSLPEASRSLGLSEATLGCWIRCYHNIGKRKAYHC